MQLLTMDLKNKSLKLIIKDMHISPKKLSRLQGNLEKSSEEVMYYLKKIQIYGVCWL